MTRQSQQQLQQPQLTKAHLDTPGMEVAMAYGFVAYENTVEYKMKKWYEAEKTQNTEIPDRDEAECSKTKESDHMRNNKHEDKVTCCQNTLNEHHQGLPRRNSKRKTSIRSQLDKIPEASEDHLQDNINI